MATSPDRRVPTEWERFRYELMRATGSMRKLAAAWEGREWTMAEAKRGDR